MNIFNYRKIKFISVITVLVLLLSMFTACKKTEETQTNPNSSTVETDLGIENASEVFNTNRVKNTSGGVSVVNNLSNTYYKLKNNKKLTIGYTGGSVTDGTGGTNGFCWRTAVTQWFKDVYPDAEIKEADGSQGNKSSLWGFFRADDWVKSGQEASLIDMKPDLVFLEFTINDYLVRMSEERTIHYMEGLINKIRKNLPQTDIVIVFITNETYIGKKTPLQEVHESLAAHYGIPTIDVGAVMDSFLKSTDGQFDDYFVDEVHPNNKGYQVYADAIIEYLKNRLITNPDENATLKECDMPENWLLSNGVFESEIYVVDEFKKFATMDGWKELNAPGNAMVQFGTQLYGSTGSELEFDFVGSGVSLMVDAPTGAFVRCEIDGKETVSTSVMNSIHNELYLVDNLTHGKHHIKIRIVQGKRFIIGALLIEK